MRTLTVILCLLPALAVAQQRKKKKNDEPRTAIESTLVVKVTDRNKVADRLIEEAEELGGYFSSRTDDAVVLKVPVNEAELFIMNVVEPTGKVIDKSFKAQDVGAHLAELRTRLKSRQQVFQRYFNVLGSASPQAVVEVEATMTALVQDIENLKGAIRLIEHQLQFAQVVVRFEFRERQAPVRDGSSSFAWLNTVNLADLIEEFGHAN